jgi:hypothetical protein
MYKIHSNSQISFDDFNQPMGLTMNPKNRWIEKANLIPWSELEKDYAKHFPNQVGNPAKSLRMALGSLMIQNTYHYSDEETVAQIQENPYLQFFIGLPGYQDKKPFDASTMVYFRKRLDGATLAKINEQILSHNQPDNFTKNDDSGDDDKNAGTLILDATCAPQNIKFPTDTEQLNDARIHAETIIDDICERDDLPKPRIYRRKARKAYLNIVRRKRKSQKWLRPQIRKMLNFLKRDIGFIADYLATGHELSLKHQVQWETIKGIYDQQFYMYQTQTHSVEQRIVSFSQPWLRPIVRGKLKATVEFGVKLDMSVDHHGFVRFEKTSFEAYNESSVLIDAIRRFHDREGHFPARVLVDKIYRNRKNIKYCKDRGIRIMGDALGRPPKGQRVDQSLAYQDNADRIEVERDFSLLKRCYGMQNIRAKLPVTTLSTIGISLICFNLGKILSGFELLFGGFWKIRLKQNYEKGQTCYFWVIQ